MAELTKAVFNSKRKTLTELDPSHQTLKQSDLFKVVVSLFAAQLRQDEALLAQGKSVSLCGKYVP